MPEQGKYTDCALENAQCLLPQRVCTKDALCLALEMARLSYDTDIAPWLRAGWEDVSFQVDDLLLTGLHGRDEKAQKVCLQAAAKALGRMEKLDPISQLRGFWRQKEELDTCKAVMMAHELADGRTLIAIAFTGTTKRLYDWLSNLRMEEEEGFHAGFLRLTKQFEENAGRIHFPITAQKTAMVRLSLQDILQMMRQGSDRFSLFVTGHSQGAALMQIYIHRLISSGVPLEHLRGIGFASPCVVNERALHWATAYPIRHFINADDLIARVGGHMHIGQCCVLPSSDGYRRACYGPHAESLAMRNVLHALHALRDNESTLLFGVALMNALAELPDAACEETIALLLRGVLPGILGQRLRGYARRLAREASRRLTAKGEKVFGSLDAEKCAEQRRTIDGLFAACGSAACVSMLVECLMRPHALAERDGVRAYQLLAQEYANALAKSLWVTDDTPVWDARFSGERCGRKRKKPYNRLRPLSAQKE